jgi:CheY-like chemotaxis protein
MKTSQGVVDDRPPLRVLVADDSPLNRAAVTRLLGLRGHAVTAVADGRAAVTAAGAGFDAILMDLQMPELDGFAAAAAIRAGGATVPIIAMTASAATDERARCVAAGMDGYLAKPFEAEALYAAVEAAAASPPAHPGGDAALVVELLQLFLDEAPALIDSLRDAPDDTTVRAIAHRLVGSLGSLTQEIARLLGPP